MSQELFSQIPLRFFPFKILHILLQRIPVYLICRKTLDGGWHLILFELHLNVLRIRQLSGRIEKTGSGLIQAYDIRRRLLNLSALFSLEILKTLHIIQIGCQPAVFRFFIIDIPRRFHHLFKLLHNILFNFPRTLNISRLSQILFRQNSLVGFPVFFSRFFSFSVPFPRKHRLLPYSSQFLRYCSFRFSSN